VTRVTVTVLISAVVLGSFLGIAAVVRGDLGPLGKDLLWTAILIACGCVVTLGSTERWERPGGRLYAAVGIACSVSGFLLLVLNLWWDGLGTYPGVIGVSLAFVGVTGAHGAAVSRASLPARLAWVRWPALICAPLLAFFGIGVLWGVPDGIVHPFRTIGVFGILTLATTLLVASAQRVSK